MAPRKEKTEKASADQSVELILNYLRRVLEACRSNAAADAASREAKVGQLHASGAASDMTDELAMSVDLIRLVDSGRSVELSSNGLQASDISSNLHNRVTKAAAVKYLKEMHERKEIEGRASGKQIVYHVTQNPDDAATPEDLAAMDAEIQALRDETAAARTEEKSLKASLATTNATMSTADLRASVQALECEKTEITTRLQSLRSGSVKPINAEEKAGIEAEWQKWKKIADARRKICVTMWKEIRDGYLPEGVDEKELAERFGFEST